MESREGTLRSIAWRDVLPSVLLFRTLRVSFRIPVLLIAFAGFLLTLLGGWLIGGLMFAGVEDFWIERWNRELFEPISLDTSAPPVQDVAPGLEQSLLVAEGTFGVPESPASTGAIAATTQPLVATRFDRIGAAAVAAPATTWWYLAGPVVQLFDPHISVTAISYLLLRNLWNVLVWAFCGGAISRIAAFELTRQESLGIERAAVQAGSRFPAHLLAPLIGAAAILLTALPLVIMGVFIRLEFVAWVAGMLWFAILLVGLLLAVLTVGLVAGWPLMWAAIAVEQSDAFDAVSRAYAYVYQRPLHLLGYVVIVAALGVLGAAAVGLFALATIALADWAIGWGSGNEVLSGLQGIGATTVEEGSWMSGAAAGRDLWTRAALAVAAAYPIGFLWCAAVGIYLLLRRHVDGAQTDEIADDELEMPTRLPAMKPHESGVPEVEPRAGTTSDAPPSARREV